MCSCFRCSLFFRNLIILCLIVEVDFGVFVKFLGEFVMLGFFFNVRDFVFCFVFL